MRMARYSTTACVLLFSPISAPLRDTYVTQVKSSEFDSTTKIGMNAWAERGIAGRGVLIDYWSFKNKSYDPLSTHAITASDIQSIAKSQGVTFQYGDILMIRTGWTDNYSRLPQSERDRLKDIPTMEYQLVGVEQSEAMHDFLYDGYFAAVVGDQPAWEAWPPNRDWGLHRSCIALVSARVLLSSS
jgi:hypothetical protein